MEKTTRKMIEGSSDKRSESSHVGSKSLCGCFEKRIIIIMMNSLPGALS